MAGSRDVCFGIVRKGLPYIVLYLMGFARAIHYSSSSAANFCLVDSGPIVTNLYYIRHFVLLSEAKWVTFVNPTLQNKNNGRPTSSSVNSRPCSTPVTAKITHKKATLFKQKGNKTSIHIRYCSAVVPNLLIPNLMTII